MNLTLTRPHFPKIRITALGVLASIGILAIVSSMVIGPYIGYRYYQVNKQNELATLAQNAWTEHWKDAKDAEGKSIIPPTLQNGIIQYPNALLFPYTDPVTNKLTVLAWLNNPKIDQDGLKNVWFQLNVETKEPGK